MDVEKIAEHEPVHTPQKPGNISPAEFHTPGADKVKSEVDPEDIAAAEFRKKHPELAGAPGAHVMHKKRLERGHKYFDSGDYNMARAKSKKDGVPVGPTFSELEALDATGEDHPTPESIPHKKYPPAPGASKLAL